MSMDKILRFVSLSFNVDTRHTHELTLLNCIYMYMYVLLCVCFFFIVTCALFHIPVLFQICMIDCKLLAKLWPKCMNLLNYTKHKKFGTTDKIHM
jgi:hypothetical protein